MAIVPNDYCANTQQNIPTALISCDTVVWIKDILHRHAFIAKMQNPGISRIEAASETAALLEIMEILHLAFEDDIARHNAVDGLLPR